MAAILVVVDHAIDESWGLGSWTEQNHGITIFALLTGFLLSGRFLRSRLEGRSLPAVVPFLRARAVRIFPAYWLALGVAALTVGLHAMGPGDGLRIATLTQTFDTDTPFEGLIPMWSLSLFLSFYLFLPVWAWVRSRADRSRPAEDTLRREVFWLLGLIALAFVVRALSLTDPIASAPEFSLFGRFDWFAVGMLLTVLVIARSRSGLPAFATAVGRRPAIAFAAAIGLTTLSALAPASLGELRNQLDLAAAALVVFAAILHGAELKGPQRLLASRPAQALGRWSYGIFVWGYVAEKAIVHVFPGIGTGALLITTLAAGIALGAASWRWIERPISDRFRSGKRERRRLTLRSRRPAGAPAT